MPSSAWPCAVPFRLCRCPLAAPDVPVLCCCSCARASPQTLTIIRPLAQPLSLWPESPALRTRMRPVRLLPRLLLRPPCTMRPAPDATSPDAIPCHARRIAGPVAQSLQPPFLSRVLCEQPACVRVGSPRPQPVSRARCLSAPALFASPRDARVPCPPRPLVFSVAQSLQPPFLSRVLCEQPACVRVGSPHPQPVSRARCLSAPALVASPRDARVPCPPRPLVFSVTKSPQPPFLSRVLCEQPACVRVGAPRPQPVSRARCLSAPALVAIPRDARVPCPPRPLAFPVAPEGWHQVAPRYARSAQRLLPAAPSARGFVRLRVYFRPSVPHVYGPLRPGA